MYVKWSLCILGHICGSSCQVKVGHFGTNCLTWRASLTREDFFKTFVKLTVVETSLRLTELSPQTFFEKLIYSLECAVLSLALRSL